jgi:hypothetical protein
VRSDRWEGKVSRWGAIGGIISLKHHGNERSPLVLSLRLPTAAAFYRYVKLPVDSLSIILILDFSGIFSNLFKH